MLQWNYVCKQEFASTWNRSAAERVVCVVEAFDDEVSYCRAVVRLHGDLPAAGRGGRAWHAGGSPLAGAGAAHAPLARLRQAKRC